MKSINHLPAFLLYKIFKFINAKKVIADFIITEKNLNEDEKAEKYFLYELKKAPKFDKLHQQQVSGKTVLEIGSGFGGYVCHLLKSGSAFVIGIDTDEHRVQKNKLLIDKYYYGDNYTIRDCDACDLNFLKSGSIDFVVSDAAIEHIFHRQKMFKEINRVLKSDGLAFLSTSPIWFTWNGGHLMRYIPLPWGHLLLPDKIIFQILELQKQHADFPKRAINDMIILYQTIGKLSIRKLKREIKCSGLKLIKFENISNNSIKRVLVKLPILEELFAGNIQVLLKK